jgi:hypothetical protein
MRIVIKELSRDHHFYEDPHKLLFGTFGEALRRRLGNRSYLLRSQGTDGQPFCERHCYFLP